MSMVLATMASCIYTLLIRAGYRPRKRVKMIDFEDYTDNYFIGSQQVDADAFGVWMAHRLMMGQSFIIVPSEEDGERCLTLFRV